MLCPTYSRKLKELQDLVPKTCIYFFTWWLTSKQIIYDVIVNKLQFRFIILQNKLKGLYTTALSDAKQEETLIRQALASINEIRTICNDQRIQVRDVFVLYCEAVGSPRPSERQQTAKILKNNSNLTYL